MFDEFFLHEGIFKNCVRVVKTEDGLMPLRFTGSQMELYGKKLGLKQRSSCPSGVCMDFETDSSFVKFEYTMRDSVRNWAFFDIYLNGVFIETSGSAPIDRNCKDFYYEIPKRYQSPEGKQSRNRVTIYLPHMVDLSLQNIMLSKGAEVEAIRPFNRSILCLGDSITQGMDSKHPSLSYPVLLSRFLEMNLLNQGVGGYIFDAGSLDPELPYKPDLITIAYGTNDWSTISSLESLKKNCYEYILKLVHIFPEAKIVVITPFWRSDIEEAKPMGTFYEACDVIRSFCRDFEQVSIQDGLELAPHIPEFYGDRIIHPSGEGFLYLALNLLKKFQNMI